MHRLKLTLAPLTEGSVPFSYNQMLATAVVKRLSMRGIDCRFAVSNLKFDAYAIKGPRLVPQGNATIIICLLTHEDYQTVYEAFHNLEMAVGDSQSQVRYIITHVKKLEQEPLIRLPGDMYRLHYTTLSPVVVRKKTERSEEYLLPGDTDFADMFFDHAYYRWLDFTGERINLSYCNFTPAGKLQTKLVTIYKNQTPLQIRGFIQRFTVTAPLGIHRALLYSGAGDLTDAGFGCVDA